MEEKRKKTEHKREVADGARGWFCAVVREKSWSLRRRRMKVEVEVVEVVHRCCRVPFENVEKSNKTFVEVKSFYDRTIIFFSLSLSFLFFFLHSSIASVGCCVLGIVSIEVSTCFVFRSFYTLSLCWAMKLAELAEFIDFMSS